MKLQFIKNSCLFLLIFTTMLLAQIQVSDAQIKIMPLGDSITKGSNSVSTDYSGYRDDLAALLKYEQIDFDLVGSLTNGVGFDPDHEGHGGFKTDKIFDSLHLYLSLNSPDIILLHIGTNDITSDVETGKIIENINNILSAIFSINSDIKVILVSIVPRTDDMDYFTTILNDKIEQLYLAKKKEGLKLFYTGMNEIFKCNLNWAADYYSAPDFVHPNDIGYNIMGQIWYNSIMTVKNSNLNRHLSDNFDRKLLGITWDSDSDLEIKDGDLSNTATSGTQKWQYMAVYKGLKNPTSNGLTWSTNADAAGISEGGLALLLNSPSKNASGFLAWININNNMLRLSQILNGSAVPSEYVEQPSTAPVPYPGDRFRVDITRDTNTLNFEYFVNDSSAGIIFITNPEINNYFYSGIVLRQNSNNNVSEFFAEKSSDFVPPAQIQDLLIQKISATSATLTWTASGDDSTYSLATKYDLRYSKTDISNEEAFLLATHVVGLPAPGKGGTVEKFVVLELLPETDYYFALKVIDDVGNLSKMSNVVDSKSGSGDLFIDTFNRQNLGSDWTAANSLKIINNELANISLNQNLWNLAILNNIPNPTEVSFKWSISADSAGIDQVGIALMLDSPGLETNGYLITRRTFQNQIRLWKIIQGQNPSEPINETPLLAKPNPGDVFKIVISSDLDGNHFSVFINGWQDVTISDTTFFIDPSVTENRFAGIMLPGGRNNNIDDFKTLTANQTVYVDNYDTNPGDYSLSQNYPNPFNSSTTIEFYLPASEKVKIDVYNIKGQKITTLISKTIASGNHKVLFNAHNLPSGVYIYKIQTKRFIDIKKMLHVK